MANTIEIPAPKIKTIKLKVKGTQPLICHKWSEKAKKQMLDKQMKKATVGKPAKDPHQDYLDSLYEHPDGGYGFPAIAFKSSAVRAAKQTGIAMTDARTFFYIVGELVKIKGKPSMREDMVKISGGVADIRHRGEFKKWETELTININESIVSLEQVVNLFNIAGFSVGVGEWRPEKNGQFGTFSIAEGKES